MTEQTLWEEIVQPIRSNHCDRLKHIKYRGDSDDRHSKHIELRDEIELLLIAAERQKINELYRSGRLKDEARRRIERELDVREAHLANQWTEECVRCIRSIEQSRWRWASSPCM